MYAYASQESLERALLQQNTFLEIWHLYQKQLIKPLLGRLETMNSKNTDQISQSINI